MYPALGYFVPFTHTDPQGSLHPLLLSVPWLSGLTHKTFTLCTKARQWLTFITKKGQKYHHYLFSTFSSLKMGHNISPIFKHLFFFCIFYIRLLKYRWVLSSSLMYTPWVLILLIIHLDISWLFFLLNGTLQGFHFWGVKCKVQPVLRVFTGCNTAFEEFIKGFREGKKNSERNCVWLSNRIYLPIILLRWLWGCMCWN